MSIVIRGRMSIRGRVVFGPKIGPVPIIESVDTDTSVNGNDIVIAKPIGLSVGDLMVAFIATHWALPSLPSGWTEEVKDSNAVGGAVYYKIADSSDVAASNFTFSFSGQSAWDSSIGALYRITGHNPDTPMDGSASADGESATQTAPSYTTSGPNRLVLRLDGVADFTTITVADITQDFGTLKANDNNRTSGAGGHQDQAAEGASGTYEFTTADSENFAVFTVAIAPTMI